MRACPGIASNNRKLMGIGPLCWFLSGAAGGRNGHCEVHYTFSSGFNGDGFNWPASPTGLLDGDDFYTPDDVDFYNYTGNNVFFDSQYQVIGNASNISGDALWADPLDSYLDIDLYGYGSRRPSASIWHGR